MAICPACRQRIRRRIGEGTAVDPNTPLSENERIVYEALKALRDATVRQVLGFLHGNNIPRSGGRPWNYHLVQLELSRLVGRGLARMRRKGRVFIYEVIE